MLGIMPPIGGMIPSLRPAAVAALGCGAGPGTPESRGGQQCLKFFDIFDLRAGIEDTADFARRWRNDGAARPGLGNRLPMSIGTPTEFSGIGDVTLWRVRWHATADTSEYCPMTIPAE